MSTVLLVLMLALVATFMIRPELLNHLQFRPSRHATGRPRIAPRSVRPAAGPVLVAEGGEGTRQRRYTLTRQGTLIGRGSECGIIVDGLLVSRKHARIVFEGGRHVLRDLDSTNGTFVNQQRISVHALRDGDVVQIGKARLRFVAPQSGLTSAPGAGFAQPSEVSVTDVRRAAAASMPNLKPSAQAASELVPGYRLHSPMEGGHATVYRATRVADGLECAVKILRLTDPFLVDKFQQEARILLTFNHPNIVRAFDTGRVGGRPFIAMEFCGGGSLRRMMGQRRLNGSEIRRVMGFACSAVHYAHAHGVIHRDLKPEHFMFDAHGNVKVVDFGISKAASSLTQTAYGMVLGTPAYLSPEQARGQEVDFRTDIYALGIVLYELLGGQVPFTGSNTAILEQHIKRPLPPLRAINPNVDEELAAVAEQALAKSPQQRFPSALAMANALGFAPDTGTGSHRIR